MTKAQGTPTLKIVTLITKMEGSHAHCYRVGQSYDNPGQRINKIEALATSEGGETWVRMTLSDKVEVWFSPNAVFSFETEMPA